MQISGQTRFAETLAGVPFVHASQGVFLIIPKFDQKSNWCQNSSSQEALSFVGYAVYIRLRELPFMVRNDDFPFNSSAPQVCYFAEDNVMLLLDFAREYQMQGLRNRCAEFLGEVIAKTPDDDYLLELLVIAHCLADHLETLIPRVASLELASIEKFHGKLDHGVLAALYLAKSRKSDRTLKSLPKPITLPQHTFVGSSSSCYTCGIGRAVMCSNIPKRRSHYRVSRYHT